MNVHTTWISPLGRASEREQSSSHLHDQLVATIEGLEAQLHSIYEERSSSRYLSAESAMESLEAQLHDLYAEREAQEADGTVAQTDTVQVLAGLLQQFAALYEKRGKLRFTATDANQMVDSLEEQVATLLEEKDTLSVKLENTRLEIQVHREKARSLMAVVVDRMLA